MHTRTRRRAGVALMGAALVGAGLLAVPAAAQDADTESVQLEVEQVGLFAAPLNDAVPDTLVESFPPQVVCLLVPEACTEQTEPLRDPITGLVQEVDRNDQSEPVHPIPPDHLAASFLGGNLRYESALQFVVPELEPGADLESFVLELPQAQPSFSFDSPLFQEIVFEVVSLAGTQDPALFLEGLAQALEEEQPLGQPLLGIEACPLTIPIPPGSAPPQAEPTYRVEQPTADGGQEPAIDCLFGTNGVFDPDTQTWSFDLTFAVQGWQDGSLPNHGILLRPVGAPNLAFGDPDTSTNAQVVLDASTPPTAVLTASTPAPPPTPPPPPTTPPASSSGGGSAPSFTPPSATLIDPDPPAPVGTEPEPAEVAPDPPASDPPPVALDATPVSQPEPMPWLWLLVPAFAAGAWLTARSLTQELVVASARPGALSRLVESDLT